MADGIYGISHGGDFVGLPETGMGYQLLTLGRAGFALVISTTYVVQFRTRLELFHRLQVLQGILDRARRDAAAGSAKDTLRNPDLIFVESVQLVGGQLIDRNEAAATNYLQAGPQRKVSSKSIELAHDISPMSDPKMFFRFSAVPNDPRIEINGSFVPGTYATTFNDLRMAPSGLAAVGRYALPIPYSARFVRSIVTNEAHRMGTALPRFSQSGGGVEVLFDKGAKAMQAPHQMDIG